MKAAIVASLLLAAPAPFVHAQDAQPADLIVHNAKVVTVDAKFTVVEAVAVRGGKIAAVGTSADPAQGRRRRRREARPCCRDLRQPRPPSGVEQSWEIRS